MATIFEALDTLNSYPIPSLRIDVVMEDNSLIGTDPYTAAIGLTESYQLATADLLIWLSEHPDIVEQAVGIKNAVDIKENMRDRANKIYNKYGSEKFSGGTYGFIGEDFNG